MVSIAQPKGFPPIFLKSSSGVIITFIVIINIKYHLPPVTLWAIILKRV